MAGVMIKNFILGFGCGIVILAAVTYFYYGADAGAKDPVGGAMSDNEIVERARELGMLTYMDFIRSDGSDAEDKKSGEPAEVEIVYETVKEELSDAEIIDRALALGMYFFHMEEDEAPGENEPGGEEPEPAASGEIRTYVQSGSNAGTIANVLFEHGVITDPVDFVDFLVERGMAGRLLSGEHIFRQGMDYEEILTVLRGNKGR